MDIMYGMSVSGPEDEFILRIEDSSEKFGKMKVPGAFLADIFPVLQYIPAWCPGAGFQREFNAWRPTVRSIHDIPWAAAMEAKVRGRTLAPLSERLAHASPRT